MKSLNKAFLKLKEKTAEERPMEGHALRFQQKLERKNSPVIKLVPWLSIAACFLLFFGMNTTQTVQTTAPHIELTQFYEKQINQQLVYLETNYSAQFEVPIRDVNEQMTMLDVEYKKLQTAFNENHQHPLLLRAMIDNLQQRLELLMALEKQLNPQNEQTYENERF